MSIKHTYKRKCLVVVELVGISHWVLGNGRFLFLYFSFLRRFSWSEVKWCACAMFIPHYDFSHQFRVGRLPAKQLETFLGGASDLEWKNICICHSLNPLLSLSLLLFCFIPSRRISTLTSALAEQQNNGSLVLPFYSKLFPIITFSALPVHNAYKLATAIIMASMQFISISIYMLFSFPLNVCRPRLPWSIYVHIWRYGCWSADVNENKLKRDRKWNRERVSELERKKSYSITSISAFVNIYVAMYELE